MYKKFLPALLLTVVSQWCFAQAPTLTAGSILPAMGDAFAIYNCDPTGITPGSSGAGATWDFSALHLINGAGAIDTGTAVNPASTEPDAIFSASNLAVITPGESLIAYYIESDSTLSQNGLYTSLNQYTAYSDPMDQLQFPFTFNNTFTDTYSGFIVYTPSGGPTVHAINTGTIIVTADAYGTLTLPGMAEPTVYPNALRVHSIQSYTDSVNLFGTRATGVYSVETYTWYTPGYHNALLTIATATGPGVNTKNVSYSAQQIVDREGVTTHNAAGASLTLYPNPVTGELNIAYNTSNSENVRITLSDMLGREAAVIADNYTQGAQHVSYNTATLPKGLYLVRFQTATKTVTKKIELQ